MTTSSIPRHAGVGGDRLLASADRFVASVLALCERSPRAQADLRSGLGRPYESCHRLHAHLLAQVGESAGRAYRQAAYAVASLIAGRPRAGRESDSARTSARVEAELAHEGEPAGPLRIWERPSLGRSLGESVRTGAFASGTAESTLHLMTRQDATAIITRLPALTGHLTGRGIEVDWAVLLRDLSLWDRDRDRIATRWLEQYYATPKKDDQGNGDGDAGADGKQ